MIGEIINNYLIDEIIDEGGMSTVYLGIHKLLKRKAAVKKLKPSLAKNPQTKERFKQEAITMSKFNHPNITAIFDYIDNSQGCFIISEYVKGQTLEEYIELVTGPIPETKAIKIFSQILDAVSYIHSKNIIHRDIKPSNIIITTENKIKMLDFGIAKSVSGDVNMQTKDGSKIGTTMFMSPQQIQGRVIDRRSDIYSLGATLFYILTGQFPYDKNLTEYEIYNKIIHEPFPNPKEFYKGVSDKMCEIIAKSTSEKPLDRFQTCDEFNISISNIPVKKVKPQTVSLQTKIIDATDIEIKSKIFSKDFLQNLIMLAAALIFTTAIGIGIYYLNKKDVRHIIAPETFLYDADSTNSKITEKLNYGETVRVMRIVNENKTDSVQWIRIASLRNNSGYIKASETAVNHVFKQINVIMGNSEAAHIIPAEYKNALRKFYIENNLYSDNTSDWKLFAELKNDFEYNTVASGNFDNKGKNDIAVLLNDTQSNRKKMIVFFDNSEQYIIVNLAGEYKIKTVKSGKDGGRWFLGNFSVRNSADGQTYETQKYEFPETDAILVLNTKTDENVLYMYNSEQKTFKFFAQPK